jgi:SAM-dependent methyltransferase
MEKPLRKRPNKNWYTNYKEPSAEEMNRVGSSDWVEFVNQSNKITPMVYRKLRDHVGEPLAEKKILDFGCGVGRIALQLYAKWGVPSHCRDVNAKAIKYLRKQLPAADCKTSKYAPPLDLPDNAVDAVYSISIWTHIAPDLQIPWLREIERILKPGGVALISTSGAMTIRLRKERGVPGWHDVSTDQLKQDGMVFRSYSDAQGSNSYPGIDGDYGLVSHDPNYIRNEWGKVMEVVALHERVIDDVQDLIILRKAS